MEELQTVSDIYRKWDKVEKAKFYDAIITKKIASETGMNRQHHR